ncbi:ATP-binding protein [Polaromonas sp.]|uniref:ATP-binding protein n=1 Tax=Polaromonas sp. TaxID=1869339 RepID=UPI002488C190|nr:ATP-binding protein [Polaromonas sp.]MDI1273348.1 ATP-binding protein [Polaromonas sp.]
MRASSEFEGSGMGLVLVKQVINRHNGRVWAEAVPGEGATFFFTLPLHSQLVLPPPVSGAATALIAKSAFSPCWISARSSQIDSKFVEAAGARLHIASPFDDA